MRGPRVHCGAGVARTPNGPRRPLSGVLATLCGLVLLAGCVTVPTSGPVERHAPAEQQANPGVDIAPVPPAQGASPGLIVEGFLHAMATYQPGYVVARQFLTADAAESWQPESGVEIYAGGYPPQVSDAGVVLTAPLVGTLDPRGTFTPADTPYLHDFGLVRDAENQWRISRPPRGLLVSQSLFTGSWVRADVCFWDVTGDWLVPDPRFVPSGAVGLLATARAVLAGPAHRSAAAYARTRSDAVTVSSATRGAGGVVTVDLVGETNAVDAVARRKLAAELVWSLSSLEGVLGVRVRGKGVVWGLNGGTEILTTADFQAGAPVPADAGDGVYLLRGDAVERATWAAPLAAPQAIAGTAGRASALAVRADGQVVAMVTDGGTRVRSVAVREGTSRQELTGTGITGVRWSRQDELWVMLDRQRAARLRAIRDGREVAVDTSALPIGRIRSFAPAPDGVRAALVIESQGRRVLGVAAVVRGPAGMSLIGWRQLTPSSWARSNQPLVDVGWAGAAELLVLLGGSPSARVVSVDSEGAVATDVRPNDAAALVQLASAPSGRAVLRGPDGQTWRFVDGFTWEPWLDGVAAVALP
ncbi:MAG: LpqB family beta-propeller domain-containing protein [Micropruina sp.]